MKEENIVKKVCKELGITQKELAEMLDIPAGTVSRWASTDEIPKTAKVALECMLELKECREKLEAIKKARDVITKL